MVVDKFGKDTRKVLLTYAWCRSSYSALKSLASNDIDVVVADSSSVGMCQWSKHAFAVEKYRSPLIHPEGFVDDVVALCLNHEISIVIPGHDEGQILAKYTDRLAGISILTASFEKLELANNKRSMSDFALSLDVPIAPKINVENAFDLGKSTHSDRSYVVRALQGNGAKGVLYSKGGDQLTVAVTKFIAQHNLGIDRFPVVQEYVNGDGWGVSCLYWHGQRIASFTHKRLEEKTLTGGTSTLRVGKKNPCLEKYAYTLLDGLKWHGLAMVEFKFDEPTQKGYFIEINPRLWGSIDLARASGIDFPYLMYLCATGDLVNAKSLAKIWNEGVVSLWVLGDLIRRLSLLKNGQIRKSLSPRTMKVSSYDDLDWSDFRAFVGQCTYYARKGLMHRSTNPIEKGMIK